MNYKDLTYLIVEDNEMYKLQLKTWLKNLSVEYIYSSSDLHKATLLTDMHKPDIIFMDNNVLDSKGVDIVKLLLNVSPNSSIVLMSSNFSLNDVATSIQQGVSHIADKNNLNKLEFIKIIDNIIETKTESNWSISKFFSKSKAVSKIKNIAIVEDNKLFAFYLTFALNQLETKHNVNVFETIKDFYNFLSKNSPDYVFLDYNLPDGNGLDVIKFLKTNNPDAGIVIVSDQQDPNVVIELKSLGIENYFIKDSNAKTSAESLFSRLNL